MSSRDAPDPRERTKAVALGASVFALYLLTRTRHFGGDDTVFATLVQRWLDLGRIEPLFFHPHHLLYNPLVAAAGWLLRKLTGAVFVLDVGAAVSAAAAAAAIAGVYLVARRAGASDDVAALTAAVTAVSGGMWQYATNMEVYTLGAAGVVVWLAAVADQRCSWRRLATGMAAPWLGHTALLLLVFPAGVLQRRRPRVLAAALVAGVLLPGLMAVALLARVHGVRTPTGMVDVLGGGGLAGWLSAPDPAGALRAVQGLVVWRSYSALPVYPRPATIAFDLLGDLSTLVLAAAVVWGLVVGFRRHNRLAIAATAGIAALVPLWLVWDTGNTEHVVAAVPLFAVVAAVGFSSVPRRLALAALGFVALALLLSNGLGSALVRSQPQLSRTLLIAEHVHRTVPEEGALIAVGIDPELRLSLPYLSSRRVIDLTFEVHAARRAGASAEAALRRWLQAAAVQDDAWLLEDVRSAAVADWVRDLGVPPEAWQRAVLAMDIGPESTLAADGVVIREPVTLRPLHIARAASPP